ncbi:scavenger receptor cysteine-rich type 1 protein M130-like [Lytechinus pictus]|uniref:scavenger receptor cysteine-rich type 1 protein M130-like n=1 Tax=Lytechinus pictus TaxID=7653 RepID=UPI0030BA08C5
MAHFLTGFNLMVAVYILTRIISGRETNVRLRNGLSELEGRVEILINGTWGTICDKNFNFNDALVVCRSLNFSGALGTTSQSEFGPSLGKIHSDILRCNGTETDILECLRTNSDPQTKCSSSHEAGVRCSDCRDVNPRCQSWANQDACESYPGEVLPVCQLSCDQCNTTVINDSASYLSMNETCVAGHCYLDSNNAYRCIPAVELCVTVGWYQGLICIPTPTSPTPSSVRCMHFEEREQTNLDALAVKHKLSFTISGLAYTTSTVDQDIVFTVDRMYRIFDQLTNEGLTPRQIYDRQRQVKVL